ncbi:cytochrome c biogenesis CcdA family protein [Albidovulum sediminis]|uniref:Cytochrome c biogenesis protein CcdA n=1 Tax=Albidovulum sediminis TaxID=3066345 RepID=A0ABT2NHM3_9RHOB|nr:cytochrome c biogenesis protein CcdA [Defluviimonas sediminis]MCT8328419.1 cytochrome c biogenesis protein CcdA [Defluviimonas sediminis]
MIEISFGGALLAGFLAFFSPCVLPMVPFYLSYLAGVSVSELGASGGIAPAARRRLVLRTVAFALGVTTIFMLLGLAATGVGRGLAAWMDTLSWAAAAVLILFGLHFLGILRIGLFYREARLQSDRRPTTLAGAYVLGLAFGFGWTPCVGPALAAILMIAGGMGEVWRGGALLLVFGLAMTSPFVLASAFAGPFLSWLGRHRAIVRHVETATGILLIVFGVLIATDSVNLIADWMIRNFDWSATVT